MPFRLEISVPHQAGRPCRRRHTRHAHPGAGPATVPAGDLPGEAGSRRDGPIRRSLALCRFRPLTRRRCGGRGCSQGRRGLERLGWRLRLVAMEWGSESAAVRRHRVGGERRDGPAAAPQPGREAPAQEPPADACGGGARTRKRSAGDGGGVSRGAGTGLSEARAALGLALYLLALRALVQLSLQQLVLRGAAGRHGEFDARQARYPPLPLGPRVPCGPGPRAAAPACARPRGIARARRRRAAARGAGRHRASLPRSPRLWVAELVLQP